MAGCEAHNLGGDNDAGIKRVTTWTIVGAIIGAALVFVFGAGVGVLVAVVAAVLGAVAGAALGFFIGSLIDWFGRLKSQDSGKITMIGRAACAGLNPFGLQPWTDGDWTVNLGTVAFLTPTDLPITVPAAGSNKVEEIRLRAAPGSGLAQAAPSFNEDAHTTPILHCELSAHQGTYSIVGGAIGSVAGTTGGFGVGAAACGAAAFFGFIGAAVCLLIVAAAVALGAAVGGAVGDAVGAFGGWVVDELSRFEQKGKTIEAGSKPGCTLLLGGDWVTDTSHGHNEIHDITFIQIHCDDPTPGGAPPSDTRRDRLVATNAIGRRPTGDGPMLH